MTWRSLRAGEIDHEAIWLCVSVSTLFGAWVWFHFALPVPGCVFHRLTGLPCPTCGITRCLRYTFHHEWRAAAGINPLAFVGLGGIVAYDLYAATVLAFRLPRLRCEAISLRAGHIVRYVVIAAVLANWVWLIWMRV